MAPANGAKMEQKNLPGSDASLALKAAHPPLSLPLLNSALRGVREARAVNRQPETPVSASEERIGMASQSTLASYDATPTVANEPITPPQYQAFQDAYDFFNVQLFACALPNVLVTFQRHAHTRGYFCADRFSPRIGNGKAHELAMNPDAFTNRSDEEILSTLAHEMVHVWQQVYGKPGRGRYHNREWANKMKVIGLYPSASGQPGGKETGSSVSHYILPAGPYAAAYTALEQTGFKLQWQSTRPTKDRERSLRSKTKFTCARCGQNAWAKPTAALGCCACGPGAVRMESTAVNERSSDYHQVVAARADRYSLTFRIVR
jgi:hypothetical protein